MLTFRFNGADGIMTEAEILTSGMVGKTVRLEFSEEWEGLTKTAVFTAGDVTCDVVDVSDRAVIPAAVLAEPLHQLYVGVYGVAADGAVTPTVRAAGPRICPGADPSGDEGTDPDLPVWAQIQVQVDALKNDTDTEGLPGTPDFQINAGAISYASGNGAGQQLGYYWESGTTRATMNPFAFSLEKGGNLQTGLSNDSDYRYSLHIYRASAAGVDYSYTPNGTMVWFPGEYERLLNTGLISGDYEYAAEEDHLIACFNFGRVDQATITEDDLAAIREQFSLIYTAPAETFVPSNLGSENANRYLVTDAEGNVVAGHSLDGENGIPAYWTEYLQQKLTEIRAAITAGGTGGDAFLYFTDHHIGCMDNLDNANNTRHIIDFVRKYTPIQNVFFGGDILNTTANQTREQALRWLWAFHDDYIRRGVYPVLGNHEIQQYDTSGHHIAVDEAYAILFRDAEQTADTGKKMYYRVDNPSQKIRYIVLDSESEPIGSNTAQLQWYADALGSMEPGWTAVLFAHHFCEVNEYDAPDNPIITRIAGDYNNRSGGSEGGAVWDFTAAGGEVACLICGHRHLDGSGKNNGILVIHVTTDCGANVDNASKDNANGANRKAGDVSEHSVEIFFINTAEKTVKTIRLGYGEDREWSYNGAQSAQTLDLAAKSAVALGGPGAVNNAGGKLNYYYEAGTGQATLNPLGTYIEAGSVLHVSLSDYANYQYKVRLYTCDASAGTADLSFTEGTSKTFAVPASEAYVSPAWLSEDTSMEIGEACVVVLYFKNSGYTALSADDTAAIGNMLTATVTIPAAADQ